MSQDVMVLLRKNACELLNEIVQEYLDLKHAVLMSEEEFNKTVRYAFYLPKQAVIKPSSTASKFHVVFDASAKSSSSSSEMTF